MANPKLLRISLILIEITSLPLLVLGLIYLLTGYQMLTHSVRLIPRARYLHTDLTLRIILVTMGLIHGYSGLVLMCERRIRNNNLRKIVEIIITSPLVILQHYSSHLNP